MNTNTIVSSAPYITAQENTQKIMGRMLVALSPCIAASAVLFGWRTLLVVGFTTAVCVVMELLWNILRKQKTTVADGSACVTGVILALNLPVSIPLWICAIGAATAIIVTKALFGGLGKNFANPALVGRIVLFLGYGSYMVRWTYPQGAVDALSSATPLGVGVSELPIGDLLWGIHGGTMGEVCVWAILLGLAYLLYTQTISIVIPASYVGTVFLCVLLASGSPGTALRHIISGGLFFGAVFMATDYVTSPYTERGRVLYGIFLGLVTFLIRWFGDMAEGVSFAILLGNLTTPWFDRLGRSRPLGVPQKAGLKFDRKSKQSLLRIAALCFVFVGITAAVHTITAPSVNSRMAEKNCEEYLPMFPAGTQTEELMVLDAAPGILGAAKMLDESICVVKTEAAGYQGNMITVFTSFDTDGTILAVQVDASTQTASIGGQTEDEDFRSQFIGLSTDHLPVLGDSVDSVTGATISSVAVTDAVNAAIKWIQAQGGEALK